MAFHIIRNDITKVQADAIVNTANPRPVFASGTDSAIYHAAGEELLLAERSQIGEMKTGEVNVTDAYGLQAKYIIHTVGPAWIDGHHGEFKALASCYRKSLHLAKKLGCESIAFPLISTGVYGFPKDRALNIALSVIRSFLEDNEMDVTLVVFSRKAFELSADLAQSVKAYIDDHYCREAYREEYGVYGSLQRLERRELLDEDRSICASEASIPAAARPSAARPPAEKSSAPKKKPSFSIWKRHEDSSQTTAEKKKSLQDVIDHAGETFQEMLMRLISEKELAAPDVYKKANLDKKLFSKIKNNPDYTPKKQTAVALAIALQLNLDETVDLLGRAGLALSPSNVFDLIIRFCIEQKNYDVFSINALLFDYNQPLLGC